MVSVARARELALSLPDAVERDHHGRPSFRTAGRIIATLWSPGRMNVMLDQAGILDAVQADPGACHEVWWGARLAAVGVELELVSEQALAELLADAWEGKAGRRV